MGTRYEATRGRMVPDYWWHLDGDAGVRVESDHEGFPVVARFARPEGEIGMEAAIEKPEALIEDLRAGRADPRKLAASLSP